MIISTKLFYGACRLTFHCLQRYYLRSSSYDLIRKQSRNYYLKLPPFQTYVEKTKEFENTYQRRMSDSSELEVLMNAVKLQGDVVRELKASGGTKQEIAKAVSELKSRKRALEEKELSMTKDKDSKFDRAKLEELLKHRFFYDQSFGIYGGVQGLYDFGPMGCAIEANILTLWRQFFVLEEQMLEVKCSILTPEPVLKASGHVERFTDYMVRDTGTLECYRADHLVEGFLEDLARNKKTSAELKTEIETKILPQIDNFAKKELQELIERFQIKAPQTGNSLSEPQEFNLMFSTSIGPQGNVKGFLRPETAQGMFVNFQRLMRFNQGKLPFAASQIGTSFRNEISPRSGLIRVREFTMAEIEHFLDPSDKSHPKFSRVADLVVNMYSGCDQMDGKVATPVRLGDAVASGLVANETLGYFMGRIYMFLMTVGIKPDQFRFRQHLSNEMAHYACDCWDAECRSSYGWIECVGCADRSAYDLCQHAQATGLSMSAERQLDSPRIDSVTQAVPNRKVIGSVLRGEAKHLMTKLESMNKEEVEEMERRLSECGSATVEVNGKEFAVTSDMVEVKRFEKKVFTENFIPNVIEPSFGIGRVMYCLFEQSFNIRDGDEARTFLSLPAIIAPYKCSVLPLSPHPQLQPLVHQISDALTLAGVSHRTDTSSGSIGRRYARADQIAIPYGITIDFDSVKIEPPSATLRERDSMKQIRVPMTELPTLVAKLSLGHSSWEEATKDYPIFEQQETA